MSGEKPSGSVSVGGRAGRNAAHQNQSEARGKERGKARGKERSRSESGSAGERGRECESGRSQASRCIRGRFTFGPRRERDCRSQADRANPAHFGGATCKHLCKVRGAIENIDRRI